MSRLVHGTISAKDLEVAEKNYNEWLEKFAEAHNISVEEAKKHRMADIMKIYYAKMEEDKVGESKE